MRAFAKLNAIDAAIHLKDLHPPPSKRLDELKISPYLAARDLGVPAMRINHVVHGKRPVTAEIALRLERYYSQSPRY